MVVKKGYKNTEVGVIPEDWEVKCIGDFCELTSSKRIFEHDYVSVGVPFYRGKEISMLLENKPITEPYYIAESKYESIRRRWGAPMKGEILITAVGTLCNVYLIPNDEKFYFKDGNLIWLRNISRVDFRFLVYQIDNFKKEIIDKAIGSSQKALTMVVLKKQLIPLPLTLSEQTAIATVLSDTDNLIQALEKKIAKKELIKKGAMQQLLEPKEGWELMVLNEMVSTPVTDGPHMTPNFYTKGVPFLSVNNLVNNKVDFSDLRYISKEDDELFSLKCKPKKGDLLFGKAASVGKIAVVESDIDFNIWSPIALIRLKDKINPKFIFYCFQTNELLKQIGYFTNASSQGNVGMGDIEKFKFLLPKLKEQNYISQILSDMDNEIESLQEKLSKYKQLKQGLMQELLTGRIRLV